MVLSIIGIDNGDHLIRSNAAVIVFVPQNHDGAAAFLPYRRGFDGSHDALNGQIALQDQRRIETGLRAIVIRIKVAKSRAVAAAVLVIALVRGNERKIRHVACLEIRIQSVLSLEGDDLIKAKPAFTTLLHGGEVRKRIVLHRIQEHDIGRTDRISGGGQGGKIR